jgi:serine/threonine protein kinase/ankyrin repeat protein
MTCPQCGTELPPDAPAGICPRCLMQAALNFQEDSSAESLDEDGAYAVTTPQPGSFLAPEPRLLAAHFPHLEMGELLGQGGMGAVYKARQTKLDRLVALKVIRPESAADSAFAERFNREARTLARLSHPHIVGVHDFGEVTMPDPADPSAPPVTLYYFLMEYVGGVNLRQLIEAGDLTPELTLSVISQVCDALQFAHDEGVVHRDIKPENVLLDRKGRVKIADFGLAKLATPSEQDFTLTGTHQVMGTPRYMAPEQMAGSRAVDHRADLYSLGVVFYEMLTGEIPAGRFSPPSEHAAIDGRLDDLVMKALAQKPDDRFQSASEIRAGLEALAREQDSPLSQAVAPKLPPARGLSTVFERQLSAAWHWMVDSTTPTEENSPDKTATQFPSLLMGLLSVIGLLLPLAPWITFAITDPDVVHGIPSEELTMFRGSAAKVLEKSGFEHPAGILSAILLTILAVVCVSVPTWRRPNRILALVMVVLSAGALMSAFFYPNQAPHIYLTFTPAPPVSEPGVTVASGPNVRPVSDLDHKVSLHPAFYGSVTISGILLLLSAVGLRHAEPLRKSGRTRQAVWTAELAANLMLAATIVLSLAGGLTMLLPWAEIHVPQDADVSHLHENARLAAPISVRFSGTEIWSSQAAAGSCLLVGLVLLLSPNRRSPGWIATGLMTLLSVAAVVHASVYPNELRSHGSVSFRVDADEQTLQSITDQLFIDAASSDHDKLDPEANAGRIVIPLWNIAFWREVTYREGYYAALGISIALVLLNIIGVRNAILNRAPKPKTTESWSGTPLASLRFSVPAKGDLGTKINFHFSGLGYELVDEQPGAWIFQRGTVKGLLVWGTNLMTLPTRLSVYAIDDENGGHLVNCHWSVRLGGGFATSNESRKLEDEGRQLQMLLGGQIDEPADVSVSEMSFRHQADNSDAPDVRPRDESRSVEDRAAIDLVAVEDEVSGPAAAMIGVSWFVIVGYAFCGIVAVVDGTDPEPLIALSMGLGLLIGIAMLVGGLSMKRLDSHGVAQMGAIAGMIPIHPAWLLTLPIGIWAQVVLKKPQVKRAFRENARRRRGSSPTATSEPYGSAPNSTSPLLSVANRVEEVSKSFARTILQFFTLIGILIAVSVLVYLVRGGGEEDSAIVDYSVTDVADHEARVSDEAPADRIRQLLAAAAAGETVRVKTLLEAGTDVNSKDTEGQTPLMKAAAADESHLVALLMLRGADETLRDNEGKSALMHAVEAGHSSTVKLLIDMEKANWDEELQFRLKRIDPESTKTLDFKSLHFEGGQNWQDKSGETALMKAAARGDFELFDTLQLWSDVSLRDRQGRTVIVHAIEQQQVEFLTKLLERAEQQLSVRTPGHGFIGAVTPKVLSLPDNSGRTPLDIAEEMEFDALAARMRSYLQAVVDVLTPEIDTTESVSGFKGLLMERGRAFRGLGDAERAEADFKRSQRNGRRDE